MTKDSLLRTKSGENGVFVTGFAANSVSDAAQVLNLALKAVGNNSKPFDLPSAIVPLNR
jgi:hypothetical protein